MTSLLKLAQIQKLVTNGIRIALPTARTDIDHFFGLEIGTFKIKSLRTIEIHVWYQAEKVPIEFYSLGFYL
jgi:hypothetical protein